MDAEAFLFAAGALQLADVFSPDDVMTQMHARSVSESWRHPGGPQFEGVVGEQSLTATVEVMLTEFQSSYAHDQLIMAV
jgi:hypothetical protein